MFRKSLIALMALGFVAAVTADSALARSYSQHGGAKTGHHSAGKYGSKGRHTSSHRPRRPQHTQRGEHRHGGYGHQRHTQRGGRHGGDYQRHRYTERRGHEYRRHERRYAYRYEQPVVERREVRYEQPVVKRREVRYEQPVRTRVASYRQPVAASTPVVASCNQVPADGCYFTRKRQNGAYVCTQVCEEEPEIPPQK